MATDMPREKLPWSVSRPPCLKVWDIHEGNGTEEDKEGALALANATEKALQLRDNPSSVVKGRAKSGAKFLDTRSYQGLDIHYETSFPELYFIGRSGRAAGYKDEKNGEEKLQSILRTWKEIKRGYEEGANPDRQKQRAQSPCPSPLQL